MINIFHHTRPKNFSGDTSYCWAFAIASMLRHSLNTSFEGRKKQYSQKEIEIINKAKQYLKSSKFYDQLREGFRRWTWTVEDSWRAFEKQKIVFFRKPVKNPIVMDNSTKAKVRRDKSPDWITTRRNKWNKRENNWWAKSYTRGCYW